MFVGIAEHHACDKGRDEAVAARLLSAEEGEERQGAAAALASLACLLAHSHTHSRTCCKPGSQVCRFGFPYNKCDGTRIGFPEDAGGDGADAAPDPAAAEVAAAAS